jgi:hypothetical protein
MTQEEENEIIKRREEWFRKNYTWFNNEVKRNITKSDGPMVQYHSDLIQIVVEQFLTRPLLQQKQMLDDNTVSNYLLVTCVRHLQSSSSPFYNQIRKHRMSSRSGALPDMSDEDDPGAHPFEQYDWYQCFKREMNTMSFYYRQLLIDKYQDGLTFEEIQKRYNITKNSLVNDIKNALQFLRCRCDNNCP